MFAEGGAVPGGARHGAQPQRDAVQALPFASLSFSLHSAPGRVAFTPPFARLAGSGALFGTAATEPATSIAYPASFCVLTKSGCPKLAGVGVRAKRILGLKNINVYTVGVYVDGSGAKRALGKYRGANADSIASNQRVYDDLVASTSFEKSLRLIISFGGLKRATFVSALNERLKPALAKAKEPASTLAAFERLFDNITLSKGTEIAFSTHHKGQLVTAVNGKQVGALSSPALVKALFDVYLGSDPVSADAKRSVGHGLAALLNE